MKINRNDNQPTPHIDELSADDCKMLEWIHENSERLGWLAEAILHSEADWDEEANRS